MTALLEHRGTMEAAPFSTPRDKKSLILSAATTDARLLIKNSKLAHIPDTVHQGLHLTHNSILQLLSFNITSAVAGETLEYSKRCTDFVTS